MLRQVISTYTKLPALNFIYVRVVRFRAKVGEIGNKWDKSETFSDQIAVQSGMSQMH